MVVVEGPGKQGACAVCGDCRLLHGKIVLLCTQLVAQCDKAPWGVKLVISDRAAGYKRLYTATSRTATSRCQCAYGELPPLQSEASMHGLGLL